MSEKENFVLQLSLSLSLSISRSLSLSLPLRRCYSTLSLHDARVVAALRGGLKRVPHSAMVIARLRGREREAAAVHGLHHRYYVSPSD